MKTVFKSFILIATCLFYFESFSQDVITKRDGTDIQTKILEVTPNEIKYKKFDNASGSDNLYELVEKGRQDAMMNYKGQNSGRGGVAATAILFGPVIGLIPAAIISSSEPDEGNLNTPNFELMKDPNYRKGYTDQAAKTKKKKVWKSYGIASGIWLGLIVATYAAY
mgnify:CR=1 FL=1